MRRLAPASAAVAPLARGALLLLLALALVACGQSRVVKREGSQGSTSSAPRSASQSPPRSGGYLVRTGDTLYGIAFRHGLDYREVAAWNRIPAPYTIYPGQRLTLRAASPGPVQTAPTAPVASAPVPPRPAPVQGGFVTVSPTTGPSPATVPVPHTPPVANPSVSSGPVPSAGVPATTGATPTVPVVVPATVPATVPAAVPSAPAAVSASGWRWPTQGALIGRFLAGDPKRQGVDIAGVAGQPVVAASDGVVVYSGAGLVGYGELIIIKHSDEWLSAYAHNRRRLVAEGTAVKAGQTIAELGRSGTSRDMLHFEVRRNGKPIDPLTVLPVP